MWGNKMKSLQNTSKFISYLLRHHPESVDLFMDSHGWVGVQDLIDKINTNSDYEIDKETLDKIVSTDEKQRYSYSADGTKIRANQGHSIKVDIDLEEIEPPTILYHGTSERFIKQIQLDGLKPMARQYVHLSNDEDTAQKVGARHGKPVILRVRALDMQKAGYKFYRSVNGVWLTDKVPVKYIIF